MLLWVIAQAVQVVYIVRLFSVVLDCSICTRRFFFLGSFCRCNKFQFVFVGFKLFQIV